MRTPPLPTLITAGATAVVVCLAILGGGAGTGAGAQTGPGGAAAAGDDIAAGRELYITGCSSCHGIAGEGTRSSPPLIGVGAAGAYFYLSTGRMPLDYPRSQARRKPRAYSPEQIDQLTAFVASLGPGPDIPHVDPEQGDLVRGRQLYTANCAACHNSAGSGGALGANTIAPALTHSTPTEVAIATRIGPGAMPLLGPDTIDDADLASVVRYVEHLKHPGDPGGLPLGRVGPIPEGLVAWLIGLGLMIMATFWIGTRD